MFGGLATRTHRQAVAETACFLLIFVLVCSSGQVNGLSGPVLNWLISLYVTVLVGRVQSGNLSCNAVSNFVLGAEWRFEVRAPHSPIALKTKTCAR